VALLYPLPKRTSIPAHSGNYSRGRSKAIRLLVIHDGETGEGATAAEGMGNWFANPAASGSAHAGFDTDSICTYIPDADKAWAAPGANDDGLHGELAGRAGQTVSQWKDADSLRILENGAIWFAEKSIAHDIPVRYLTDAQLKDGKSRGITTHRQCSRVLGGTHTDPGPNFPLAYFLGRIRFHVARLTAPAPLPAPKPATTQEDADMAITVKNPATGAQWPIEDALWSMWTYTIEARNAARNASRDAAAALAIAQATAAKLGATTPKAGA